MKWGEPSLVEYEFRFGARARGAVARVGFPRLDEARRDEWVCSFQIDGLRDSRIYAARGANGLQALTIASDAIRKSLDRLRDVSSDVVPYEIVFPRYLPFCCGLEFHRKLCSIIDAEIEKKNRQLRRKLLARKKSDRINSSRKGKTS